ncbi:hypothetical protein [Xanthomonas hortorum]|uniref:hypothetical protein n=1 Tax=Xanthomonas hortorum TaxID=56454 RepID=UPI001E4241AE|nr:hypothetical protein [Xanthomonas hortorum]MCC8553338.1 hypothetical protein [Xanthomonas hortorum pv. gardneri]MCE4363027.1 hypothetical protein [Xanthomonas hortorum]
MPSIAINKPPGFSSIVIALLYPIGVLDQHFGIGVEAALQLPIPAHRVSAARHRWRHCRSVSRRVRDGSTTGLSNALPGAHNHRIRAPVADATGCPLTALLLMPYDRYVLRDVGNVPMSWLLIARHTEQVRQSARMYDVRVVCLASRKMDASPPP